MNVVQSYKTLSDSTAKSMISVKLLWGAMFVEPLRLEILLHIICCP